MRRRMTGLGDGSGLIAEPVTTALAVDHAVVFTPLGGRHRTLRVDVDGERRWVVKHAPAPALDAEQRALDALAGRVWVPGPALRPDPGRLVTPWVASGGDGDPAALGRVLAELHAGPRWGAPLPPPWVTGLHRPSPRRLAAASAGVVSVTRTVQADDTLRTGLDRLAEGWAARAPVHGDVRAANVLPSAGGWVLVDWEASGDGDPAMDLGWWVGERLASWTGSMRRTRAGGPSLGPGAAAFPVDRIRPGIVALWAAHRDATGGVDPEDVVRWAGARLVQAAAEESQGALAAAAAVPAHLAAARAAFMRPGAVAAHLGIA